MPFVTAPWTEVLWLSGPPHSPLISPVHLPFSLWNELAGLMLLVTPTSEAQAGMIVTNCGTRPNAGSSLALTGR